MRKGQAEKRELQPDRKFGSVLVTRFINHLMQGGKCHTAEKVFYNALDEIAKKTEKDPLKVFEAAIDNISPRLEVKTRRIGGASYQVPREVQGERKSTLAIRWILGIVRKRGGSPIHKRLADELIAASQKEGAAMKKRSDTHRMAEANRAFAHFSW